MNYISLSDWSLGFGGEVEVISSELRSFIHSFNGRLLLCARSWECGGDHDQLRLRAASGLLETADKEVDFRSSRRGPTLELIQSRGWGGFQEEETSAQR